MSRQHDWWLPWRFSVLSLIYTFTIFDIVLIYVINFVNKITKAVKTCHRKSRQVLSYQPVNDKEKKNFKSYYCIQYKLTVVSGFSSSLEDLLIDSEITSIVPVHPTSRRSKAYSKASDSCFVPCDAKKVNECKLYGGDLQGVPPRSSIYLVLMGLYHVRFSR